MTKLAILSDIHGNLPALEAVLQDLSQFKMDHVIVAGDVINWGPFSAQVMERVTREGWAVIRGNNEFYVLDYNTPRAPSEWEEYSLLPWLNRQLNGRWHILNPGAVGVPLDGTFCARYMLLESNAEGWHPVFRSVN